jgi:type I restriction enzyme S subunit
VSFPKVALRDLQAPKRWALNGGPFGSKLVQRDYVESGIPVIRGCNLSGDSRFSPDQFVFVTSEKADDLLPNNAHSGDLVFTQRGTLGQVGIIPVSLPFQRYVISQSQMKLTVNPCRADASYIYYTFKTPETSKRLINRAFSSGVPHINLEILRDFEVGLPGLTTQRRIASILSAYDDLIENNTRRIKILEKMAQMLYREWFVNFRFPGHEKVRMIDSELGPIPEGWVPTRVGDLCADSRRAVHPNDVDPETAYVGLEHIPRKSIALAQWGKAADVESTKLQFKRGDILFGKIRPYFHKVSVAPVDGVASSDAIVIVPKSERHFGAVLCCVSSEDFVDYATQTSQGTKMPRANWDVLTKYPLPTPTDEDIFEQFNGAIVTKVCLIQNLVLRNRNLRTTRDLLLPKLISGEIPVEAGAEAACELLEAVAQHA